MFGYGKGIVLPLIHHLKEEFPSVKQPWYADDAGVGGFCTMPGLLETYLTRGTTFSVYHTLECKTGGLVLLRHNEITEELSDLLASKALTPYAPETGNTDGPKTLDPKAPVQRFTSKDEEQGDLLIRGFRSRGTDIIVNVCMTDTDAKSYWSRDPHKVLAMHEKEKNCK
jgi:hypothetical protein